MGPCIDFQAFKGASPAMAMAPAGSLCVAVQRCHPAAHGMMHSFRYLKEARLWSSAQQVRSSSTRTWSEVVSSKRLARRAIMATAKIAAGEVGSEEGGQYSEKPSVATSPPKPETAESKPSEEANAAASPPKSEVTESKPIEKPTIENSTEEKPTIGKPSAEASPLMSEAAELKSSEEPKAAASPSKPKAAESKSTEKPGAAASPPKPKAAGGAKKAGKAAKAVAKDLPEAMAEDIIPKLTASLEKERGVSDLEIQFVDNQLQGSFVKNQVPYNFWAYFPDGKLEGSRGFSLSSHGSPPSTVEPFLIDEKISSELVVQQIIKRLFAQKLLATN